MMLFYRAPLIATVVCLGHYWSANTTAFAFSPPHHVKHPSASEHTPTSLHYSLNRRSVFTIVPTTAAFTTFSSLFIPPGGDDDDTTTTEQYRAHADEPNNLYYKSKADEEDPLAVFGRSLQQSITDTSTNTSVDGKESDLNRDGVDASKNNEVAGQQQQLLPPGGDLGRALMEKQQQRRIDPRTHG
mmetsp:Transcript_22097/g.34704  ORF Transcript_22097/g.34704 Transcript_22097/m.34704 type:complete len:186 (-) Transcript_22097:1020-1577(-)